MNKSTNPFYDVSLKKRHAKTKRFKLFTYSSLIFSLAFLLFFIVDIGIKAFPTLTQAYVYIDVTYNQKSMRSSRAAIDRKYKKIVSRAYLREIPKHIKQNPYLLNTTVKKWVLADDQVDQYLKGHYSKLKSKDKVFVDELVKNNLLELQFNRIFFTNGDSKVPEFAGILSSIIGTILTLIITMLFAFPIGVMAAIYLEEFSKDNLLTQIIEININNLAAIPSILFGLLGLAIFINSFGIPRSSALVGGLTLALMTLPIIIVSSRAALRSVPNSIREAGFAVGLTKVQVVTGHVLPLAFPGIMTGSIIGLAQALGETAPLIIIGMIAFIPDSPTSVLDATTVLPAQIFTWAGMPERAYIEKTAGAIMVLLGILVLLNSTAIYLRKKYEVKW